MRSRNYGHSRHYGRREAFRVRPNANENSQISPAAAVRADWGVGSRPHCVPGLREIQKCASQLNPGRIRAAHSPVERRVTHGAYGNVLSQSRGRYQ